MAISTYLVELYYDSTPETTATWTKLVSIKDFPDLGGTPESLETTTCSDAAQTYIAGIKSQSSLEFTANYDADDFDNISDLTGSQDFQLWYGTDGGSGKFAFSGEVTPYVVGAGVNAVVDMKIVIMPNTAITVVA